MTGAQATRVVFDGTDEDVSATGVEFVHGGKTYVVKAEREVILSAGKYLWLTLMLSAYSRSIKARTKHLSFLNFQVITAQWRLHKVSSFEFILGIGKKEILTKYGIPTIINLPVGENLRKWFLLCPSMLL